MSITGKNATYSEVDEATFGFLKIRRTTYPNQLTMFQLGSKSADLDDPRGTIAIQATGYEMLAEMQRIVVWLEAQT